MLREPVENVCLGNDSVERAVRVKQSDAMAERASGDAKAVDDEIVHRCSLRVWCVHQFGVVAKHGDELFRRNFILNC